MTDFNPYVRPDGSPVMFQRWRDLLFLHWEISSAEIQERLPEGLTVDTFNGKAYLGVVPFFMDRVRPRFLPAVPGLSWFLELNVRTYVKAPNGEPGVWFFSLDCNQAIAVEAARKFFNLPYQHATMSAKQESGLTHYQCRRKSEAETSNWSYGSKGGETKTATPGSMEEFLLERYLLFSCDRQGQLYRGQVYHPPYEFTEAKVDRFDQRPMQWDGFELNASPCSALFSSGPDVEIFSLKKVK